MRRKFAFLCAIAPRPMLETVGANQAPQCSRNPTLQGSALSVSGTFPPRTEPPRKDRPKAGPESGEPRTFPKPATPAPNSGATPRERAARPRQPAPAGPHPPPRFGLRTGRESNGRTIVRVDWRPTRAACPNGRGCRHSAVRSRAGLRPWDC